jgi:hypothetical protein
LRSVPAPNDPEQQARFGLLRPDNLRPLWPRLGREDQIQRPSNPTPSSGRVIADAIEHTKHTALGGEILFITHLMLLPYIRRGLDWHLILDEIPQANLVRRAQYATDQSSDH